LGTHNYQIFLSESWSGSGSASCQISTGGSPPPSNPPPSNPPPTPPNPPPSGSGSCVVYNGGSALSSPFSDWSFGGSVSYSGGAVVVPIGSSWNALYARHSSGFNLNSNTAITFTAKGGSGSGNQNIQVYAVSNSGSSIGSAVVVSLAPNSYNSYSVSLSQLAVSSGTKVYGIALQAYSSSVVTPSVSFTKISITNANCGQSGAANTVDAWASNDAFNNPGMIAGIVAAVIIVIVVVVVVIIVKVKNSRREEHV